MLSCACLPYVAERTAPCYVRWVIKRVLFGVFVVCVIGCGGALGALGSSDADQDGIPDASDMCPNAPEDRDGYKDTDGCPDADNDQDGIPDAQDKCPNAAETKNGNEDEDGCPDHPGGAIKPVDAPRKNTGAEIAKPKAAKAMPRNPPGTRWAQCTADRQCRVQIAACCGTCGEAPVSLVRALNAAHRSEFQKQFCKTAEPTCLGCGGILPRRVKAVCDKGLCQLARVK